MPFDATKPVNGSPGSSAEMRSQFTSLKALIDAQAATITAMQSQIVELNDNLVNEHPTYDQSAANVNSVGPYTENSNDPPTSDDFNALRDKLNELIGTLQR